MTFDLLGQRHEIDPRESANGSSRFHLPSKFNRQMPVDTGATELYAGVKNLTAGDNVFPVVRGQ